MKEAIKLKNLLNDLLLEAVDLSDGSKVIRALERGQIPGVKKKVFLNTQFTEEKIVKILNQVIVFLKAKTNNNNFNKVLFLLMKKTFNVENLDSLLNYRSNLESTVDSILSYFNNVNKKEVKEDEEVKKKFELFSNSYYDLTKDKKFEQWVNEKFAQKAKAKNEDINVIYDDGEWTVSIPKTFAAAKQLACMADRKARWCTAANKSMFSSYSTINNPLFVIRNESKNIMYQMDWGKSGNPNFMDESDSPAKLEEVLNLGIPNKLWNSIKNKDGKSIYDIFNKIIKEKEKNQKKEETITKNLSKKINWKVENISALELNKYIRKFSTNIRIIRNSIDQKFEFVRDVMRDKKNILDSKISKEKAYKFTNDEGRVIYGILGKVKTIVRNKNRNKELIVSNPFIEIINNQVKVIDKLEMLSNESNIPDKLKKEFAEVDVEEFQKKELQEVDGVYEIENILDLNKIKNLFPDDYSMKKFVEKLEEKNFKNFYFKKIKEGEFLAINSNEDGFLGIKFQNNRSIFSRFYAIEKLIDFPRNIKEKLIDRISDQEVRDIFKKALIDNEFIIELNNEYYYDMINSEILNKEKKGIMPSGEISRLIRTIKLEKGPGESGEVSKKSKKITFVKGELKNVINNKNFGVKGNSSLDTLNNLRSNEKARKNFKESFLKKGDRYYYTASGNEKFYEKEELEQIINNFLNGNSQKIFLKKFQLEVNEKNIDFNLFFDINKSRLNSFFYLEETKEPYRAIGYENNKNGYIKEKDTMSEMENGKEKLVDHYNFKFLKEKAMQQLEYKIKYFVKFFYDILNKFRII